MASLHGRLEGQIQIPTGNWTCSLTDGTGGPYTITLTAANTYYHSSAGNDSFDLPTKLGVLFSAAGGNVRTYTVTVSAAESGTGKYTIAVDSGTYSITWTSTDLRDAIGFDANITTQSTSTGANHAQHLWLPDCPSDVLAHRSSSGIPVAQSIVTVAPDGSFNRFEGSQYTRNAITWHAVQAAKMWTGAETTTAASYETFWQDVIRGQEPGAARPGGPVRWYKDVSDDATYVTYNVTSATSPEMSRHTESWDGLWKVRVETVVAV